MSKLKFARKLAIVIVVGHILLFMYGLAVAAFGKFSITNATQMILMGSPLLVLVALAAFRFVVGGLVTVDDETLPQVDSASSKLIMFVAIAFLLALFVAYSMALFQGPTVSADALKISVGVIETALGGYLGIIKDSLFPGADADNPIDDKLVEEK